MKKTGWLFLVLLAGFSLCPAQDTGSTVVLRPRPAKDTVLALPDFQAKAGSAEASLSGPLKTLNETLWNDLEYAGFFSLLAKSYYPARSIGEKEDMVFTEWQDASFKVDFVVIGNARIEAGTLVVECRVFDARTEEQVLGKQFRAQPSYARSIAHLVADKIVSVLTAGASQGIACTRILCERKTPTGKEIAVMDYDGYNLENLTSDGGINLTPVWHPDGERICFTSFRGGNPQLYIMSVSAKNAAAFPIAGGMLTTPSFSRGGTEIAFSGRLDNASDTDIYISGIDGANPRNITHNPGIDVSPCWSPTDRQIAFISGRSGNPQLYLCDAFGAGLDRILTEGGYATSPDWSPDGRYIAFAWKPDRNSNFDIYVVETATRKLFQVTHGAGNNDNPTWAPDGRHLVFQSDRTGSAELFTMLFDGTLLRQITRGQGCSNPHWSGYLGKK